MSSTLDNAMGTAKDVVESTKGTAEHAVSSAKSSLFEATKFAIGIASALRGLDLDDALGWVGLARRRTPIGTAAVFGAGVAVGAGLGVLFAPMSGDSLRSAIKRQLDELKRGASEEVKQVERKVERTVSDVADVVKHAADTAAGTAKHAADTAAGNVKRAADTAASNAKYAADSAAGSAKQAADSAASNVKEMLSDEHSGTSPRGAGYGDPSKFSRSHGGSAGGRNFS